MKTATVAGIVLLGAFVVQPDRAIAQRLEAGDWVGSVIHLTGQHMDVVYRVSWPQDTLRISMEVKGYGSFEFRDIRVTRDSLAFLWEPSFVLRCAMYLLDDGVYQGACKDPWGGFGGIFMAPPGSDVDAIELHEETIESIAGWQDPPQSSEPLALGTEYPLGRSVSVYGRTVNLVDVGEGPVAVILEAGLGDGFTSFEKLQRLVSEHTRVVAYDRAGIGHSEPSPGARSPEQIATELHALLRVAGIPPPYVLVGHAEGSFHVRRFASLYTDEVVGMVLVDPSHEKQAAWWREESAASWEKYFSGRRGLYAMLGGTSQAEFEVLEEILRHGSVPGLESLPDVPTIVLSPGRVEENPRWIGESRAGRRAWQRRHAAWTADSDQATHRLADDSGSFIHQENSEFVLRAVLDMLN